MKARYERPTIVKNIGGLANKFGRSQRLEIMDEIDGIPVNNLLQEFGSPLFVFSETGIRRQYQRILQAFQTHYPNFQMAWSYKTNYLQAICSIYHQLGSLAEVVSEFEYEKAKKLGVEPSDIIYNGPMKSLNSLKKAVAEGARIHIDNVEESLKLEQISDELHIRPKVGVRINMDTGVYPAWTRFGANLENGEAEWLIQRIIKNNKMDLAGLHTHIGTFILSADAYIKATTMLVELYKKIREKFGITLSYFDLGGGFPSQNKLKSQYLPSAVTVPSLEQYVEKIAQVMNQHFPYHEGPKIYLETGRALIDDAGYLLTTIESTRRLPDNRRALVVDAGVNILFTSYFFDVNIYPAQPYQGTMENTVVYGPLCMNIDVLRESIQLPYLNAGEKLIIHPVGAYNVTQWMQFIHMRPPVVLISLDKKPVLIRRAETLEDIEAPEILPDEYKLVEEE